LGEADYSGLEPTFDRLTFDASAADVVDLTPDPWVPGEARLNVGIFYEGGSTETVLIDGTTSNFYIFLNGADLTFEVEDETKDKVEGAKSDRISLVGQPWWGGGVIWAPTRNLSGWTTLALSVKSDNLSAFNVTVGSLTKEVALPAADYGFEADGEWHHLRIPVEDYEKAGVDLTDIKVAFAVGAGGGKSGDALLIDNVYFE